MFDYKKVLDKSNLICIIVNKEGYLIYKNKKASEVLNILSIDSNDNILNSVKEIFNDFSLESLLKKTTLFSYMKEDETYLHLEVGVYIDLIESEECYVFDIKDVSKYQEEILESEIFKTIFNNITTTIVVTDYKGNIEKVNPAFQRLTGYTQEEARGQNPRILKSGYHSPEFFKEMWNTLTKGQVWHGNFKDKIKSGDFIWERSVISPIKDNNGKVIKYVATKENITKQVMQEEELNKLLYQDYLTGLYNRRKFGEHVKNLFKLALENDIYLFCLMIDLDNFKRVNDTYGHEIGDRVLVKLADILRMNVRSDDIASRYGGEEFVVVLTKYSYEQALLRAEKIRTDIEKAQIETNQENISVTASFGFCQWDKKMELSEWLKKADVALYEAKNSGKNKVCEAK